MNDPWCGWSVQQTATNSPENDGNQSTEISTGEYIAREFSKLNVNSGKSTCIAIPPTFERSSDPNRQLGEGAEQTVYNMLKNNTIPGLKMLLFNGQRYVGKKKPTDDKIVREKDFSVFIEFDGKFYTILIEVKCLEEQNNNHRKKATSQLEDHCKVLEINHGISKNQVTKIMLHSAWPRLNREYKCTYCSKQHAVYQKVPLVCPRNNNSQQQSEYEKPGWHLFKEKFEGQQKFDKWLKHILVEKNAMEQSSWSKILKIHTQYACGALYEEISKKFLLLGKDQLELCAKPKHELNKPRFVPGIAGAGKTVTVCAKIEKLFQSGEVNSENKVLYICFSNSLIDMVKAHLKGLECKIDMDLIEFRNYKTWVDMKDFFKDKQKMYHLISEEKLMYIFFDEAEDLGVEELTNMIKAVLENEKDDKTEYFHMKYPLGHFWFLFDVFQSEGDSHWISVIGGKRSRLRWDGDFIDQTLFEEGKKMGVIIPLRTVFRMTQNVLNHIKEKKLNSNLGNPKDSGIKGPEVVTEEVAADKHVGQGGEISITLSNILFPVIRDVFRKNIHIGEVAILFDSKDIDLVLPDGGIEAIITSLNLLLQNAYKNQKKITPEVTRSIDDKSILNPHSESLLTCKCKMFLGSVDEVKGLTLKMVVYVPFFRRAGNTITPLVAEQKIVSRTSPYYKAISRSSCEVMIKQIVLNDQMLKSTGISLVNSPTSENQKHQETISTYNKGKTSQSPVRKRH